MSTPAPQVCRPRRESGKSSGLRGMEPGRHGNHVGMDDNTPYPPEADPDQAGDVEAAEVPGEQTDPGRRLTGGDLPVGDGDSTPSEHVTPGSTQPPD